MAVKGKIMNVTPQGQMIIVCPADFDRLTKWDSKEVLVELVDARPLSDKQRKMCYALINEIADFTGDTRTGAKQSLKLDFLSQNIERIGDQIFSLSNAPMSLIAEFQRYLVDFCIEWDIPTKLPLYEYVDDIDAYVFSCVMHKKCVICGKRADLHHCEKSRVGLGFNRDEIIHEGREVITLCREHHTECHTMPEREFLERYHLNGGVIADKSICRLYKLKAHKESV